MRISFSGNNQFSTRTLYELIKQRENRKRKSGAHYRALVIADKLKVRKILIVCEKAVLLRAIPPDTEKFQFLIVIPHEKVTEENAHEVVLCDYRGVARSDRLDYILRTAIELGKLKKGEKAICLFSLSGTRLIDSLRIVRGEELYSHISLRDLKRIAKNIPVDVLYAVVNLAMEIRPGRARRCVCRHYLCGGGY